MGAKSNQIVKELKDIYKGYSSLEIKISAWSTIIKVWVDGEGSRFLRVSDDGEWLYDKKKFSDSKTFKIEQSRDFDLKKPEFEREVFVEVTYLINRIDEMTAKVNQQIEDYGTE